MTLPSRSEFLNHPLFITGYYKSGTTLLLSLLDNHPELIVLPEELQFFTRVLFAKDKERTIRQRTGFRRLLNTEVQQPWARGSAPFRPGYAGFDSARLDRLIAEAVRQHRGSRDLLLRLVEAFAVAEGASPVGRRGWVTKTPHEEGYFRLFGQMFGPAGQMFYIVRDPRDVYVSHSEWLASKQTTAPTPSCAERLDTLARFVGRWKIQVGYALACRRRHSNFHIVRYEDLVLNTEATLQEIRQWLGIADTPSLRQPTRLGRPWGGNSMFVDKFNGISDETVGRYTNCLEAGDRALLEKLLRPEMTALGYASAADRAVNGLCRRWAVQFWWNYERHRLYFAARYRAKRWYVMARHWLEARSTS